MSLGATALRQLVPCTGLPVDGADQVLLGISDPTMAVPAIGRVVALDAGLSTMAGVHLVGTAGARIMTTILRELRQGRVNMHWRLCASAEAKALRPSSKPFVDPASEVGDARLDARFTASRSVRGT
jgi:acetyl-CoA acetyltransferase